MTRTRMILRGGSEWATPLYVGTGLLGDTALWRELLDPETRLAVVTDAEVHRVQGPRLFEHGLARHGFRTEHVVPAGELSKSRARKAEIEDAWIAAGLGRDGVCVAVGGGVVGDLAGFCAATYLRGIPVVQVPTSLVAMVDSAIGGKTGIDVPGGKNLVGAFHPPMAVVSDVTCLETLPDAELRFGLAEVVKHAVIADAGLFQELETGVDAVFEREPAFLEELVARNQRIKGDVVEADEREAGLRQILNFGHTVGHALERVCEYRLPHGAAVALGIRVELELAAELRGFPRRDVERVGALMERVGLPQQLEEAPLTPDGVMAAMATDKKARGGRVRYALPAGLGSFPEDPERGYALPAPEALVRHALATVWP